MINEWTQLGMNVTKNYEFISNSQNPPKIMFFPQKEGHSASLAYNVKKGKRCNYIQNMKAVAQVLLHQCFHLYSVIYYKFPSFYLRCLQSSAVDLMYAGKG